MIDQQEHMKRNHGLRASLNGTFHSAESEFKRSDKKNIQLYISRAESVLRYLARKGVDTSRIRAVGFR